MGPRIAPCRPPRSRPPRWLEGKQGHAKILDFGLARALADDTHLTQSGAIIGTPAFMAPEQAGGEKVDHRADLFSPGSMMYRTRTGELPFQGNSTLAILSALALETPAEPGKLNTEVPEGLSDLIMRLLAKKPQFRPASAREVADALANLAGEKTAVLPRAKAATREAGHGKRTPIRPVVPAWRSRLPLLAGALVLLAGLVGAGLWALGVFHVSGEQGDLVLETDNPEFAFAAVKGGGLTLEDRKSKRTYQVKAVPAGKGEYELEVTDAGAELTFKSRTFTVKRGDKVALKAWFERKDAVAVRSSIDDAWIKEVAALPAEKQVDAVVAKLKERNPGWDGKAKPAFDNGAVTGMVFGAQSLTDLSPLRGLTRLESLESTDADPKFPGPADLSPLKGLKLKRLYFHYAPVSDLSPLAGAPLTELDVTATHVSDRYSRGTFRPSTPGGCRHACCRSRRSSSGPVGRRPTGGADRRTGPALRPAGPHRPPSAPTGSPTRWPSAGGLPLGRPPRPRRRLRPLPLCLGSQGTPPRLGRTLPPGRLGQDIPRRTVAQRAHLATLAAGTRPAGGARGTKAATIGPRGGAPPALADRCLRPNDLAQRQSDQLAAWGR